MSGHELGAIIAVGGEILLVTAALVGCTLGCVWKGINQLHLVICTNRDPRPKDRETGTDETSQMSLEEGKCLEIKR